MILSFTLDTTAFSLYKHFTKFLIMISLSFGSVIANLVEKMLSAVLKRSGKFPCP
jgi:hypothetical protein